MDEALKKMLADLGLAIKAMHETVAAKFSSADPKAADAEKNALIERVLSLETNIKTLQRAKATQKMVWAVTGGKAAAENETMVGFNKFLKAVVNKDEAFLSEMKAATGNSEGTAADGGIAVPVEYANLIIALERQSSIVRQYARIFPMGSLTRKIPRELAKPSVYWVGEATEPTKSKGTMEQITQTAKKLIAIITLTQELLEDENVNYDSFIAETVATEMGREEDKQAFVGDVSGLSDPFNGVFFASGVNSVSLDGATMKYGDLINLYMAPKSPYRSRGSFVLSSTALKQIMKLIDDQGRPIWTMPESGAPGRILGKPYQETDQIPDTLGTTRTNGTNTAILFGAWDGLWLSPRAGYTVSASDSASDSGGKSAFTLDEVWYKFRRREDITVANPEGLAKMAIPTA